MKKVSKIMGFCIVAAIILVVVFTCSATKQVKKPKPVPVKFSENEAELRIEKMA
ncbi:MAG: hypothetical protein JRI92_09305 [Deltaproteobacteria bacterium]|nr:hypothetical protein [Deltaproteobacteria bacterium]